MIHEIGIEAYTYLYPLVTMEVSRRQMTNVAPGQSPGHAPMNVLAHLREFPAGDFKVVVRPNFDTLYSSAWIDLREGPVVLSTERMPDDRFFQLPILDMWTDVFASPGSRTSGPGPDAWALVPPGWTGDLPGDLARIDCPTPVVWLIGRTQTNGHDDYATVNRVQDGYALTPLAAWDGASHPWSPPEAPIDPDLDMTTPPLDVVNALSAGAFFDLAMSLLAVHPPHRTDGPTVMRMHRIGLVPGGSYAALDAETRAALDDVPAAALAAMHEAFPRMARIVSGWQMNIDTMGVYGNSYVKRALVTMIGLGANSPEDAVYPVLMADADGEPLTGERDYVLRFEANALPPVGAFWSVTMYDADGFQIPNPLDRFALGDRDPLVRGADGSIELYLQGSSPGPDREANWLPTAPGPLGVTMRLYAPGPAVLHGTWAPPAVRRSA